MEVETQRRKDAGQLLESRGRAFVFVGRDGLLTDRCKPVQPSINQAFDASRESSPVQPDAGKQRFLAVSLLYTERTDGELPERAFSPREVAEALGVSPEAVRELCRRGVLEHFRMLNAIRITRAEFERFVSENLSHRRARDVIVNLGKVTPRSRGGSAAQ